MNKPYRKCHDCNAPGEMCRDCPIDGQDDDVDNQEDAMMNTQPTAATCRETCCRECKHDRGPDKTCKPAGALCSNRAHLLDGETCDGPVLLSCGRFSPRSPDAPHDLDAALAVKGKVGG